MAQKPGSDKVTYSADHRKTGLFAGIIFFLFTLAGVVLSLYAIRAWWFPPLASAEAASTDSMMNVFLAAIGIVFVGVHIVLAMFLIRFASDGKGKAVYWHEDRKLELTWTIIPAVILISFTIYGGISWFNQKINPAIAAEGEPFKISITAAQFAWYAQYPGPDGILGRTHSQFVNNQNNPVGIDPDDPAGADDIVVVNDIWVPVNQPIHVELRARDVIHSFFVPDFRLKQDAVPGRVTNAHFLPTKTGDYEVACAELCGTGHYIMRSELKVVPQEEFNSWLQQQYEAAEAQ